MDIHVSILHGSLSQSCTYFNSQIAKELNELKNTYAKYFI